MPRALSRQWPSGTHIAFTGIDGSGKTTQAGMVAHYLRSKFGPTYLAEPRTDFISKLLHVLARQHGHSGRRDYFGHHVVDFSKSFDVVRDYYSNLAPLLSAGMHVIEPRSVYCRIGMALGMSGRRDKNMEEVLSLIPQPDIVFWLDADARVALQRVEDRGIDEEELDDLERFSAGLREVSQSENWVRIDGDLSATDVFERVKGPIDLHFRAAGRTAGNRRAADQPATKRQKARTASDEEEI